MGSYSVLKIGKVEMQWKYYIPPTLAFLFDYSDGYVCRHDEEEGCEGFSEAGFRTTVGNVLSRMDAIGYTEDFFIDIYNDFYDELNQDYEIHIDICEQDGEEVKLQSCIGRFPSTTPLEDIDLFIRFLEGVIYKNYDDDPISIELAGGKVFEIPRAKLERYDNKCYFGPDAFGDFLYKHGVEIPPGLFKIASMFEDERFYEYSDIILLFSMYLLLKASPESDEVKLDYIELMDECDPQMDIAAFHDLMTERLVHKVTTYNKVFRVLLEKDSWLNEYYGWKNLRELWNKSLQETDKYKKGVVLEQFAVAMLEMSDGFKVEDRRLNNGDEEIDILIANHVNDAFWVALQSPFIFVECKNWVDKVRSKDIRDFQGKLENHSNLCRLGIVIAVNGFTDECEEYLKRLGRSSKVLLYITGNDIDSLLTMKQPIKHWLEDIIRKALV